MELSGLFEHPLFNIVYFWTILKWLQLLQGGERGHGSHLCQVWTISDAVCKLRHVWPFIGLFVWENSRNTRIYRKSKQIGVVPCIGPTSQWQNLGSFDTCRETMCSQKERTAYSDTLRKHDILLDILEMNQLIRAYQVWRKKYLNLSMFIKILF